MSALYSAFVSCCSSLGPNLSAALCFDELRDQLPSHLVIAEYSHVLSLILIRLRSTDREAAEQNLNDFQSFGCHSSQATAFRKQCIQPIGTLARAASPTQLQESGAQTDSNLDKKVFQAFTHQLSASHHSDEAISFALQRLVFDLMIRELVHSMSRLDKKLCALAATNCIIVALAADQSNPVAQADAAELLRITLDAAQQLDKEQQQQRDQEDSASSVVGSPELSLASRADANALQLSLSRQPHQRSHLDRVRIQQQSNVYLRISIRPFMQQLNCILTNLSHKLA